MKLSEKQKKHLVNHARRADVPTTRLIEQVEKEKVTITQIIQGILGVPCTRRTFIWLNFKKMWLEVAGKQFKMLRVLIKLDEKVIYDPEGKELKNLKWPVLVLSTKEWDEYRDVMYKSFTWDFVELKEYEYENKKDQQTYTGVNLVMDDNWEEYHLRIAWNSVSRSLLNSLAGAAMWGTNKDWIKSDPQEIGKLKISVYGNVKGEKIYPCISVYNDEKQTNWKFSIAEQQAMIKKIETSKGIIYDYGAYESALKELIPEVNNKKKLQDLLPF